jgi:hypothetical protein
VDEAAEEVVRVELVGRRDRAQQVITRGAALMVGGPLAMALVLAIGVTLHGYAAYVAMLLGSVFALIALLYGCITTVNALSVKRHATHSLRVLDERRKLPEARLLR